MGIFDKIKDEAEKLMQSHSDDSQQADQDGQDTQNMPDQDEGQGQGQGQGQSGMDMQNSGDARQDMQTAQNTIRPQGGAQDMNTDQSQGMSQDQGMDQNQGMSDQGTSDQASDPAADQDQNQGQGLG